MKVTDNFVSIIGFIRRSGYLLLTVCIIGELSFFYSLPNIYGCVMSLFSWWVFSKFFLKRSVILNHPFSWLFYVSMVLYRFLPLIATFLEGKPITYGFENPYYTIWGEMVLFTVQSLAFFIVCYGRQNVFMPLRHLMAKMDFYTSFSSKTIWIMGAFGLLAMALNMASGGAEYGDVGGKFIAPLSAMKYIPLVMFFPSLYRVKDRLPSRKALWLYLIFLEVISMAGNSREALIHPLGVFVVLSFLNFVMKNVNCRRYVYTWKFPVFIVGIVLIVKIFTIASDAMLQNRKIRTDVSAVELLQRQMNSMHSSTADTEDSEAMISYLEGWDETYVDNFLLNRYCNMRITDETLHYTMMLNGWDSYGNKQMRDMFWNRLLANFPTPVLKFLSINIDKSKIAFSEGDYLYAVANNTSIIAVYRVASHLALGMACFGLLYFPIQFILLLFSFYLMDTLVSRKNSLTFSLAGLAIVFELVGRFRNGNGCIGDASYLMRAFWQFLFLYWVTFSFSKAISNLVRR